MAEIQKIRKNILLYKLRHKLDDATITSVRDLMQLKSNNDILQHQISVVKENYEDLDHNVRQKSKIEPVTLISNIFCYHVLLK